MTPPEHIHVVRADYSDPLHSVALVDLLDTYARDPMGGGHPLNEHVRQNLVAALAARSYAFSVLAFVHGMPAGLVNCIEGFSTFACAPLINVHDVVVRECYRGQGVARQMMAMVELIARERGACKLTLEVLQGNTAAKQLYRGLGFANYELDPAMGAAQFMQKWLP